MTTSEEFDRIVREKTVELAKEIERDVMGQVGQALVDLAAERGDGQLLHPATLPRLERLRMWTVWRHDHAEAHAIAQCSTRLDADQVAHALNNTHDGSRRYRVVDPT